VKWKVYDTILSSVWISITVSHLQWSGFLATDPEIRIRFPALPDFLRIVDLERGPLSLVNTTEELLGRESSGSGLKNRDYYRRGSAVLTTRHPYIRKTLVLTSATSGGHSVGIVRSQTKATEILLLWGNLAVSPNFIVFYAVRVITGRLTKSYRPCLTFVKCSVSDERKVSEWFFPKFLVLYDLLLGRAKVGWADVRTDV
jgi:hypothetical protein